MIGKVSLPRLADLQAVGDRPGHGDRHSLPLRQRRAVSSPVSGSTPEDRDRGPKVLRGDGGARDQAAAADGDEKDVEVRDLFEELRRRRRPLPP